MQNKQSTSELTFTERLQIELMDRATPAECHRKFEEMLRKTPGFDESWLARDRDSYIEGPIKTFWAFWLNGYVQLKADLLGADVSETMREWAQSEREGWRYADELEQERKRLAARVEYLEGQLVKEAARTASEKLRADQMSAQHSMQAQMHRVATNELARLKMTKIA